MKQLKSYFQRVDELKSQLKNMRVEQTSPQNDREAFVPSKSRVSSRVKQPLQKHTSFNGSRKGDSSMSRLYAPTSNKSNTRYKPRSISESKQSEVSRSSSHFVSNDYERLKMSYLKNIVKKPKQETKPAREEIKRLVNSIKCRDERPSSRLKDKSHRSNTVSVSKSTKSTSNMFQSLQVDIESMPFKLSYSYRTKQGVLVTNPKKVNQDSLLIKTKMLNSNIHLFAVADGHGLFGHLISQLAAKNLSKYLESYMKNMSTEEAFKLSYLKLQQLINDSQINASCSGSTLVSVLVKPNELVCANTGDSRAILVRKHQKKYEIIELSNDHKPCVPEEKKRILRMGGRIDTFKDQKGNPLGPERVWLPNQRIQGLAMSRSLGDNVSKEVGVTCEPQIMKFKISEKDQFIVLASDGVWQFITNEEIVQMVGPYYRANKLEEACDCLMKLAYERWTVEDDSVIDDITLILIFLNN